ncbi:heme NO-binding protein [Pseudooceanicola sediminis]|uniref:Heme NO-binding protein n=1 Tax=Pseudooceanicola sediminis TaxID=2211117 RepID=A0A399J5J8_9RHOB|nr:heme NO-binding domain-containing protein [Pseudooceanicola sediminis]KAA2316318.1 heme NO-binding protein [Puniceibacterium sp. HSS470]RII39232.1 heme NO-binding protein [Pseudooceanicola sediminis]|tara:strand:+ start:39402 stop:39989 length:588 start_codon:yes stop_codon:yes gene_type:complete
MHGLINRSIQCFLRDTYGEAAWSDVALAVDLPFAEFEAMLAYDDALTWQVLDAACLRLDKPLNMVLEDIGTYLVSHPNNEGLRRLLRFAGVCYEDFLHSLDDLPDRTRLAVSDLDLPVVELRQHSAERFSVTCHSRLPGFGHVLVGVLRAMADDYGALVLLDYAGMVQGIEKIEISLVETAFAEGRSFDLGARAG